MSLDMKMTILVVDDSGTMRLMFKQYLKKAGFDNVVLANDGRDAIEKLKVNSIDLIISDWNMPNMDGLELLQWVRKNEPFTKIPFMMATAQGDKAQQARVAAEGGNNHIAKPFDAEQIKAKIVEMFDPKSQGEKAAREREFVDGKVLIKAAHIQITDHLILGILRHQIETGEVTPKHFALETQKLPGWNPLQELLENGDVDCAFVLAPIAMDLFAFDTPIKLVLFAHKNGSSFIRNKKYDPVIYHSMKDYYKYKVVDIPHKMSIHNMLSHQFLKGLGLRPGVPGKKAIDVRFEVVPPIKMPGIMKENEDVGGFMVAEPIASKAVALGIGELQFMSAELWDNHPCCVVSMRDEFIEEFPDAVYEFTDLLVKAGKFVESNLDRAAEIAVKFLDPEGTIGLVPQILKNVLSAPKGITTTDLYPVKSDLDRIQTYMHDEMGIGKLIDMDAFVDLRFADAACKS